MYLLKLILETTKHVSPAADQNHFHIKATRSFHQIYKVSILIPPESQNTTNIYFSVQHTPRFLLEYCRQHHFSHAANSHDFLFAPTLLLSLWSLWLQIQAPPAIPLALLLPKTAHKVPLSFSLTCFS